MSFRRDSNGALRSRGPPNSPGVSLARVNSSWLPPVQRTVVPTGMVTYQLSAPLVLMRIMKGPALVGGASVVVGVVMVVVGATEVVVAGKVVVGVVVLGGRLVVVGAAEVVVIAVVLVGGWVVVAAAAVVGQ